MDIKGRKPAELFALYQAIRRQLREQGVIRSNNAPAADWAEYLAQHVYAGTLAPASEKSRHIETEDGRRLQVRSRVVSDPPQAGQRQLTTLRSFDFDALVIVLLNDIDYSVVRAVELSMDDVKSFVREDKHVNGYRLIANDTVLSAGHDRTDDFRVAAQSAGR